MSAFILTKPRASSGGVLGVITEGVAIPKVETSPTNVVVVDAAPNANAMVKWVYSIIDDINEKVLSAEVNVTNSFNNTLKFSRHSITGDILSHTIDVKYQGSSVVLEITNLTSFDFRVNILRIDLPF